MCLQDNQGANSGQNLQNGTLYPRPESASNNAVLGRGLNAALAGQLMKLNLILPLAALSIAAAPFAYGGPANTSSARKSSLEWAKILVKEVAPKIQLSTQARPLEGIDGAPGLRKPYGLQWTFECSA
jgi:hypothetical protein